MKPNKYHIDDSTLLTGRDILTVDDYREAFPEVPLPSLYAHIRKRIGEGAFSPVGKGRYQRTPKLTYRAEITPWMREISTYLTAHAEGINHCVRQQNGNLIVETGKDDCERVCHILQERFDKVALEKSVGRVSGLLEGYILVGQLISEAPYLWEGGCHVATLEKTLVDKICKKQLQGHENPLQRAMEQYPVNLTRLKRYAARRGVFDEITSYLNSLNLSRLMIFNKIQSYLPKTAIQKAWVFGSFARGEETPESDLDLLVTYDPVARLSLLGVIRYKKDLEKLIGREVDLVEDGYLMPFARPTAEHDKYLIYER